MYYDPATGRFTQEDPIGLAGGLNLYGFANGDPVNFSDPFGLCKDENGEERECIVYATGADDLSGVRPEAMAGLRQLANEIDQDLGVSQATIGEHDDPRHGMGLGFDVNVIGSFDIGSTGDFNEAALGVVQDLQAAALAMPEVRTVLGPLGHQKSLSFGGPRVTRAYSGTLKDDHQSHFHLTFYSNSERR